MNYETILYDVDQRVLTLTLNRPERLNAFTGQMKDELIDAFDRADADDDIRAIIVTGAGRGFCAGADLSAGGSTFSHNDERTAETHRDGGGQLTLRIFELKKPIIAAINGPAVGVGVTMTLAMDIRLGSEKARFGFVFSRRGIVPEACSTWFLPRIVGIAKALQWVYSGKVFEVGEAADAGLVSEVTRVEDLLPRAREIARDIAENTAPVSIALARQMLWNLLGASHPMEAHKMDSRGVLHTGRLPDAKEGVESFLEKRAPVFTGSTNKDMPEDYPWWEEHKFS